MFPLSAVSEQDYIRNFCSPTKVCIFQSLYINCWIFDKLGMKPCRCTRISGCVIESPSTGKLIFMHLASVMLFCMQYCANGNDNHKKLFLLRICRRFVINVTTIDSLSGSFVMNCYEGQTFT
jgi:hypothetical protein